MDNTDLYTFLDQNGIAYERYDHPPVYTCEEADRLVPKLPGTQTKNLFLCDDRGRTHFLVVVPDTTAVDLKALGPVLEVKKLRFCSAKRLGKYLGVAPGAVTLLAVVNDREHQVGVVLDRKISTSKAILCHPLVNTSTLVVPNDGLFQFLDATGHLPRIITVPERER